MKFDVIILAGGLGTRLRSVVSEVPKCMAPVGGKPFLYYLLSSLRRYDVGRVVLSVGYLKESVFRWLGSENGANVPPGGDWPFEIDFAVEKEPLGTGGGIRLALSKCREENVVVLNGDTFFNVDLETLVEIHCSLSPSSSTVIALKRMISFDRYGSVEIEMASEKLGKVLSFREKEFCEEGLINGGVYSLKRSLVDLSSLPEKFSFEKDFLVGEASRGMVEGMISSSYFIDIGIPEDYERAQLQMKEIRDVMEVNLPSGKRFLFLDRDGVINRQIVGDYVRDWSQFEFISGIREAIAGWSAEYERIFIVTNQRGVGKGLMSESSLEDIHSRMLEGIKEYGGRIDGIYVSTATDSSDHDRKPQTGLFERACADFPEVTAAESVMVGDSPSDAEFASNCGMAFVRMGGKVKASSLPPGTISNKSKRIAKNTLFLYFRMFILLVIGLFTSRVVLKALGVVDVGVYNAVAAMVTSFTIISNSLSTAISRFITFGLGKSEGGDKKWDLHKVFSTGVLIEGILAGIVLILVELVGVWFLNNHMNIPAERLGAANYVLQFSALMLVASLMSVPFNAVIIAHEQMKAFAYISLLEAVLKLGIAFALYVSPIDKLVTYSALMLLVSVIVRAVYASYCNRFRECRGKLVFDRDVLKEMAGFAGWNFFGSASYLCNTQGISIITNLFFGVVVNAARGYAVQVEGIVRQFVTSFTTALNPQITKSYAEGDRSYCYQLVCKGAKYSWILMLLFAIPFVFESDILMRFWLGDYPKYTDIFVPLAVVANMVDMLGNSMAILEMATGNIKKYYLIIGGVSFLVFPISWICFALGAAPESSYIVYIAVYALLVVIKMLILRRQIGFPAAMFRSEVLRKILYVTLFSFGVTAIVAYCLPGGVWRLLAVVLVSTLSIGCSTYFWATTPGEKAYADAKVREILTTLKLNNSKK